MLVSAVRCGRAFQRITAPTIARKVTVPVTIKASRRVGDGATAAAGGVIAAADPLFAVITEGRSDLPVFSMRALELVAEIKELAPGTLEVPAPAFAGTDAVMGAEV